MEITLNSSNFQKEVIESDLPVLVDFWASWCGPCMMLADTIEQLSDEYDGVIKVGKVNVDENMQLAEQYQISSIPAVFLFKDGSVVDSLVGFRPKSQFVQMIEKYK